MLSHEILNYMKQNYADKTELNLEDYSLTADD